MHCGCAGLAGNSGGWPPAAPAVLFLGESFEEVEDSEWALRYLVLYL